MVSLEFFIDIILPAALYGPGVDSASNRNDYQEYFLGGKGGRCVGLTTLPSSCADCLEIWENQPPGTLWALGLIIHRKMCRWHNTEQCLSAWCWNSWEWDSISSLKKKKKKADDCFNLLYRELYIPSIFNKLCIKVRKKENWEKQIQRQMQNFLLYVPPLSKLHGISAVFTAAQIKLNSFHICVLVYLPSEHQSTVHIRTLRVDFDLTFWRR